MNCDSNNCEEKVDASVTVIGKFNDDSTYRLEKKLCRKCHLRWWWLFTNSLGWPETEPTHPGEILEQMSPPDNQENKNDN